MPTLAAGKLDTLCWEAVKLGAVWVEAGGLSRPWKEAGMPILVDGKLGFLCWDAVKLGIVWKEAGVGVDGWKALKGQYVGGEAAN
jgi:hypothetical protein